MVQVRESLPVRAREVIAWLLTTRPQAAGVVQELLDRNGTERLSDCCGAPPDFRRGPLTIEGSVAIGTCPKCRDQVTFSECCSPQCPGDNSCPCYEAALAARTR